MTGRRLLFVADSLDVGGAERVLVQLASGLVARGHAVTVACTAGGALAGEAERAGVMVDVVQPRLAKRVVDDGFAAELARLVSRGGPDLVHTHMYASTAAASAALGPAHVPLVVHEHSEAVWRDAADVRAIAPAYARAACVLAASASIRRRLVEVDHVAAWKIRVLENVAPAPSSAPVSVSRWRHPVVSVVARLQPEKGVGVFLRAAARLRDRLPGVRFVVVGDGPLRGDLERLAGRLGLPVRFLGFRADAPALMAEFDILVVPSFTEGTPLVVLEAAAAGVPVVASAVGGIPDQVRNGVDGLLVPPGNHLALADACTRLLSDRSLAARLARSLRERHTAHGGFAATVDALERIYDEVLTASPHAETVG